MKFKQPLQRAYQMLGVEQQTTTHGEKLFSTLGAFVGIAVVWWLSQLWISAPALPLMLTSMGASAVLLFAVPHGTLSQPWPLVGGHLLSAIIGVACQRLWPGAIWTAPLAVSLAVGVMYYLRCIHPPGGATALTAVIGGEAVWQSGFDFVLFPVAINVACILIMAVLFNYPLPWRRYPSAWVKRQPLRPLPPSHHANQLTHEDFSAALREMNSLIDVSPEDLAELVDRANRHAESSAQHPPHVDTGRYYSNGMLGQRWSIRQVIDSSEGDAVGSAMLIYKTVAGRGAYQTGICRESDFKMWARFEVTLSEGHWLRVCGSNDPSV